MLKLLCILLLMMLNGMSHAAGSVRAKITFIHINVDESNLNPDTVSIKFESLPTDRPECATDELGRMAFKLDSQASQAFYSMALAAHMAGREVYVVGTGECISTLEEVKTGRLF